MSERQTAARRHPGLDRTAGVTGALTYALVGLLPVVTDIPMSTLWWVLWAVGLPLFVVDVLVDLSPRTARLLVLPMMLLGTALYAVEPLYGFGGVPMVITAASAGLVLPLPTALGVVAVQSAALLTLGYGALSDGGLLGALFYVGLQVFAVMTGQITQRESRARERLAQVHASLREAHAELEAAQARLAETSRTEERLRISRDLHDLVGHQLSALALNLEVASHVVDGPAAEQVHRSRQLAKELLADVRQVVGRLREDGPDVRGALERMAAQIPRPVVHLDLPDELTVPSTPVRDALVRGVQEALTNAVRHSGAGSAWVGVRHTGEGLEVVVRDDGAGADPLRPGNGLTGMRERIEAVGGTVEVDGSDGFRVRLVVPAEVVAPPPDAAGPSATAAPTADREVAR